MNEIVKQEPEPLSAQLSLEQVKQLALCGIFPETLDAVARGNAKVAEAYLKISERLVAALDSNVLDTEAVDRLSRAIKAVTGGISEAARLSSFAQGGPDSVEHHRVRIEIVPPEGEVIDVTPVEVERDGP